MKWINVTSVSELKKFKTLKNARISINKDVNDFFKKKGCKDKNINGMIKINSNSWQGLYDKIVIFRELLKEFDIDESEISEIEVKEISRSKSKYFSSEECEYIFYLLELDGKERGDKLKITRDCYFDKKVAKKWRDNIAKKLHPDKCSHKEAANAISKLNQLYEDMIS
ncbi:hypothetical protein [Clostridium sp.]|uniref:hypothetical protein n=1 Tax=Clostridium sp. TaxID=1506 RepID=UPI002FCBA602